MIFTASTFSWEQRKLGEIGSVSMCRRIFQGTDIRNWRYTFYKIGTFGADPDAFISRELLKNTNQNILIPKREIF